MGGHRLHAAIAVVLAGLWGGLLGFGQFNGDAWFLERVEATLVDLRTLARGVRPAPPNVLIVAIDDETVRIEGGYPVSRKTLSGIVDAVAALGPNVVALDILLLDAGIADEDRALAASLARSRSVLAGAAVFGTSRVTAPAYPGNAFAAVPVADRFVLPREAFAENAAIGIVNLATDHAGTPRFVPMVFRDSSRIELAFPLQAASMALDVAPEFETDRVLLGARRIATDIGQRLPIGYYGPRGTVETVSAAAVIAGGLDRRQVEGRVVVIGATVIGSGDVFPTPFDPVMPGVEVISTAISNMLAGDGLVRNRSTRLADAGTAIVLPMLFVALLAWRRSLLGLAAIAVVLLAWLAANFALFKAGTWLSVSLPLAAGFPAAVLFGAFHIWQDRRLASALARRNEILQRFQAPALREWLEKDPLFLAEPVRQEAAVVFIDLSGFTGLSQVTSAAATRDLLDDFYRVIEQETLAHGGVITSFMGDGAMIVFGLPQPAPGNPADAIACATALVARSEEWIDTQPATRGNRIGIKLGAHCGSIIASRLGGGSQQQITATGDTVNVASRLMEVAARNDAELALSEEIYRAAGEALPISGTAATARSRPSSADAPAP
jgi:adenylate cyclase